MIKTGLLVGPDLHWLAILGLKDECRSFCNDCYGPDCDRKTLFCGRLLSG